MHFFKSSLYVAQHFHLIWQLTLALSQTFNQNRSEALIVLIHDPFFGNFIRYLLNRFLQWKRISLLICIEITNFAQFNKLDVYCWEKLLQIAVNITQSFIDFRFEFKHWRVDSLQHFEFVFVLSVFGKLQIKVNICGKILLFI